MTTSEEQYKKDLKDAGVDMPELEDVEAQKAADEAKAKEESDAAAKKLQEDTDAEAARKAAEEKGDDPAKPAEEKPKEEKKRSIYDDLKDKKKEARTEKERADIAEQERDELKVKLEAIQKADTPEEKKDALDEFEVFAKEIDADPEALRKMRDFFLKGIKPNEELQQDLLEFKAWKNDQQKHTDVAAFETEFTATIPALKSYFPTASEDEMKSIKTELDKISHSTGWNDKSLDYIAFKHQKQLSALVSPRKQGLESRDKKDGDATAVEFDPSADLSTMSVAGREVWEKTYKEAGKTDGLVDGRNGKRLII